ncbi:hypothetical protein RRF57_011049 [Xylaria bambusicola]|uniref:Protein kinase domain-containing protein n=1 Tax=Xylaria bambusicola TaxID=326684 RepID=A0AAN7UTA0_9PEZI
MMGYGGFGFIFRVGQKGRPGGFQLAVKIALHTAMAQLRNEISILKQLNGAKHIVKMIASADTEIPSYDNNRFPPLAWVFDPLTRIQGPALAMEFMNGGNLVNLFDRIAAGGGHIPNRLLWSLLLCMIRACIGMAYPIGAPLGTPTPTLETIQRGRKPGLLQHNDIELRNMMVRTAENEKEHQAGFTFKLIDFGAAKVSPDTKGGPPNNLFGVSQALASLITMKPLKILNQTGMHRGFETAGAYLLPRAGKNPYPWLDTDLANLMAECMYIDPSKRPALEQALNRATQAVEGKTPNNFPNPREETDRAVRNFTQRFVIINRRFGIELLRYYHRFILDPSLK